MKQPSYSGHESRAVEVNEQSRQTTSDAQIGNYLRRMHWQERFDRFHFNDDHILHYQICSIGRCELNALVCHREFALSNELQTKGRQFVLQALKVDALQQAWPERAVYLYCGGEDIIGGSIDSWVVDQHARGLRKQGAVAGFLTNQAIAPYDVAINATTASRQMAITPIFRCSV